MIQVVHGLEIDNLTPDGLIGLLSSVSCGAFVLTTDQTVVFWNDRAREILGYMPERVVGRRCSSVAHGGVGVALSEGCEDGCPMMRSLRDGQMPGRARLRMRCAWGERKWLVVTPMAVSGVEQSGPLLVYLFGDAGEEAPAADVERLVELGGGLGRGAEDVRYVRPQNFLSDAGDRAVVVGSSEEANGSDDPLYRYLGSSFRGSSGEGEGSNDGGPARESTGPRSADVILTDRQREVLSYLALGWETKYIAEELGVSWYTVRKHIENLRRRLGASSRLDAVMIAMRLGIIPSE